MKVIHNLAVALNALWLFVIIFFVGMQGTASYDIIGYSILTLVVITPVINLVVLFCYRRK